MEKFAVKRFVTASGATMKRQVRTARKFPTSNPTTTSSAVLPLATNKGPTATPRGEKQREDEEDC